MNTALYGRSCVLISGPAILQRATGLSGGACDEKAPNLFKAAQVGSCVPPTSSSLLPQWQKGLIRGAEPGPQKQERTIMSPLTPYSPGLPNLQPRGGAQATEVGKGPFMSTSKSSGESSCLHSDGFTSLIHDGKSGPSIGTLRI